MSLFATNNLLGKSTSETEFVDRTNEIKILSYNLSLIPKCASGDENAEFPCKYQDERVAEMFRDGHFDEYDILCLQECFKGLPGHVHELFILYAQKAGFLYSAVAKPPAFY